MGQRDRAVKTEDSHGHKGHEEVVAEDGSRYDQGSDGTGNDQSDGWQTTMGPVGQRRHRRTSWKLVQ
jgi:hypothetical protein